MGRVDPPPGYGYFFCRRLFVFLLRLLHHPSERSKHHPIMPPLICYSRESGPQGVLARERMNESQGETVGTQEHAFENKRLEDFPIPVWEVDWGCALRQDHSLTLPMSSTLSLCLDLTLPCVVFQRRIHPSKAERKSPSHAFVQYTAKRIGSRDKGKESCKAPPDLIPRTSHCCVSETSPGPQNNTESKPTPNRVNFFSPTYHLFINNSPV